VQVSEQIVQLEVNALPRSDKPGEFWFKTCLAMCTETVVFTSPPEHSTVFEIDYAYPNRCKKCDKEKKRVGRMLDLKKLVRDRHQKLKNPKVGFLTLTLPGEYAGRITENVSESVLQARVDLYACWGKFWRNYLKKHCVGAYRFFEWTERVDLVQLHLDDSDPTTVDYRVHPHLHILVLQEGRSVDINHLRTAALAAGFGNQIDMEWRGDRSGFGSIDYVLSYAKKDLQIEGRNRQGYGILFGKGSVD
jgi:hypothetical protein